MAEAAPPEHNWRAWAVGIAATVAAAAVLGLAGWLFFGFEKYVEGIATRTYKNDGVPQTTVTALEQRLTTIETQLQERASTEAAFRLAIRQEMQAGFEQQHEDYRQLVEILSRRQQ